MNNKGFAISGIMYSVLIIFLVMITLTLFQLQNKKVILDELKIDTINAVESENNYEYLLEEISKLKNKIGDTNVSNLNEKYVSELIWTNPDFTAEMGFTTLELDLSKYEFIEVVSQQGVVRMKQGETGTFTSFINMSSAEYVTSLVSRTISWSDVNTITIQQCWVKTTTTTNKGHRSNEYIIPRYIFGLKKI